MKIVIDRRPKTDILGHHRQRCYPMSNDTILADAILALPESPKTILLPASDLARILNEVRSLRNEFDQFREQLAEDQAADRRRIKALEVVEPQPAQKKRGEVLKALIAANGGKMFAKEARQQMSMPKNLFSMLLRSQADCIKVRHFHLDHRRLVLEII